jgi:hypothetical protein
VQQESLSCVVRVDGLDAMHGHMRQGDDQEDQKLPAARGKERNSPNTCLEVIGVVANWKSSRTNIWSFCVTHNICCHTMCHNLECTLLEACYGHFYGYVKKNLNFRNIGETRPYRNVDGSNVHGCPGDTKEMKLCNTEGCPTWTDWTPWTQCSKSCGGGRRVRVRECALPKSLGKQLLAHFCPGDEKIIESCNDAACPKPTEWEGWGECSKSCGGGMRTRTRECVNFR